MSSIIFPRPLRKGDRIAIISPASAVKPEYVDGAARAIAARGFVPVVMPHAKGPADGSFASLRKEPYSRFHRSLERHRDESRRLRPRRLRVRRDTPGRPRLHAPRQRQVARRLLRRVGPARHAPLGRNRFRPRPDGKASHRRVPPTTPRRKPCSALHIGRRHRALIADRPAQLLRRSGRADRGRQPRRRSTALPRQGSAY